MKDNILSQLTVKTIKNVKEYGITYSTVFLYQILIGLFSYPYYLVFKKGRFFFFRQKKIPYYYHWYNIAHTNERSVEVPIILDILKYQLEMKKESHILEVGNVLFHYIHHFHDVVDKYEVWENVINSDILDFHPEKKYDVIISISTIEHVGFEEGEKSCEKLYHALDHMKSLLVNGGKLVVTFPIGYNNYLDNELRCRNLIFHEMYSLQKISRGNDWIECSFEDIRDSKWYDPYPYANGLVIGVINK